ncbi:MAG TPA: winged helix-turn-helix domain-containing protein [Rudaea sp.]|jgi:TolB-like protein/DNA-binding winged helix-turn-helix (wHTH) protein/Flp pilus assembly protein TadD|uniref:winged helix-turn-helix domain-containing protein n=1 Tax=Rudaea sp. TaxID=2136325 RepID=UPI002F94C688
MSDAPDRRYQFDSFCLDTLTRELRGGDGAGPAIALNTKAFDTLCFLIENRHRVVSKDELLASVWAGRVVEENNLTQAISALRAAFGASAGDHRYIVTVPGRGYRFVAELRADKVPALEAASNTPVAPVAPRWRWAILLGALLIALALFALVALRQHDAPAAQASSQAALAVLPFRSLSSEPHDELIELGLADTLIARISNSTTLLVRSLSSSQRFAGPTRDPLDAGRQLGANYVVDGSFQRNGDVVRVSTRLLAVRDGSAVWSGTFDEKIDRVFTLQDNIATAITSALAVKFSAAPDRSPCDGANAEAYRAYLTGRYQLDRPTAARMQEALTAFRRAIDLDPTCASAYAGMAAVYRTMAMVGDQEPRKVFPLGAAAVKKALTIAPNSAEAYYSQGFIQFWYDWDWAGAETSLKHAIELNPSLAQAHMAYAQLLRDAGRYDEAVLHARQAIALDPLNPLINTVASQVIESSGKPGEGRQGYEKALELEPDFWIALRARSFSLMQKGDLAGALADLRRAREICADCSQVLTILAQAFVLSGDRGAAEQILNDMEARDRAGYMPATSIAAVYNSLGNTDEALTLLERGYDERAVRMSHLQVDQNWNNLRTQPRFQALVERMKFPAVATQ